MPDLLDVFRQKADDLLSSVNSKGGIRATLESLRRQMAEADRKRAMSKVRNELKRLDKQINEMVTAVGVQAVGLHKIGKLHSPELQPLCQHIVELENAVSQQKSELAKLEAEQIAAAAAAAAANPGPTCASCGKPLPEDSTFCPYCGTPVGQRAAKLNCASCGAELRPGAKFCARCGTPV